MSIEEMQSRESCMLALGFETRARFWKSEAHKQAHEIERLRSALQLALDMNANLEIEVSKLRRLLETGQ
jgi:regulator of replication initiation timing